MFQYFRILALEKGLNYVDLINMGFLFKALSPLIVDVLLEVSHRFSRSLKVCLLVAGTWVVFSQYEF